MDINETKILTPLVVNFIKEQRVMRLASITKNNNPHVIPLCFVLHKNSIWFHAEGKRKRHENFQYNKSVSIIIDKYVDEDWKKNQGVLIKGKIIYHLQMILLVN